MYGKQTVKSEFSSEGFPAAVHAVALVQLRGVLQAWKQLKSESAPKEILAKPQAASTEMEYLSQGLCISEDPFHHIHPTNCWCLKKYWGFDNKDRNTVSKLICPVY